MASKSTEPEIGGKPSSGCPDPGHSQRSTAAGRSLGILPFGARPRGGRWGRRVVQRFAGPAPALAPHERA